MANYVSAAKWEAIPEATQRKAVLLRPPTCTVRYFLGSIVYRAKDGTVCEDELFFDGRPFELGSGTNADVCDSDWNTSVSANFYMRHLQEIEAAGGEFLRWKKPVANCVHKTMCT